MKMEQLKRQTLKEFNETIIHMMDILKKAEKSGEGIDLTEFPAMLGTHFVDLDGHFMNYQSRLKDKLKFSGSKMMYVYIGLGAMFVGTMIGFGVGVMI